jgi:hypothetical protein
LLGEVKVFSKMGKNLRFYLNKKKKKEVKDINKNGLDFKLVISYVASGDIWSVMERPGKDILSSGIEASGAHVFRNPEFNHIDIFASGALVAKEFPIVRGSTNYG